MICLPLFILVSPLKLWMYVTFVFSKFEFWMNYFCFCSFQNFCNNCHITSKRVCVKSKTSVFVSNHKQGCVCQVSKRCVMSILEPHQFMSLIIFQYWFVCRNFSVAFKYLRISVMFFHIWFFSSGLRACYDLKTLFSFCVTMTKTPYF